MALDHLVRWPLSGTVVFFMLRLETLTLTRVLWGGRVFAGVVGGDVSPSAGLLTTPPWQTVFSGLVWSPHDMTLGPNAPRSQISARSGPSGAKSHRRLRRTGATIPGSLTLGQSTTHLAPLRAHIRFVGEGVCQRFESSMQGSAGGWPVVLTLSFV